jgi:hypothetical protein
LSATSPTNIDLFFLFSHSLALFYRVGKKNESNFISIAIGELSLIQILLTFSLRFFFVFYSEDLSSTEQAKHLFFSVLDSG